MFCGVIYYIRFVLKIDDTEISLPQKKFSYTKGVMVLDPEIEAMIECAGVSSFYLGKKGLAYVSAIDARPRRS